MDPTPDIFQFTHFRKFLEEAHAYRHRADPFFTRTEVCAQLGLSQSRSYFSDVLRGKKLTPRMALKLCEVFTLDPRQSEYFLALVQFDQAENPIAKAQAMEALLKIHPNPQLVLKSDSFEYFNQWYHSTFFAILDVLNVGDDLSLVAKRIYPKVSLTKLNESLELLKRLGLVRKNDEGFYKPTRDSISSGPYNNDDLIRQYQIHCFELSKQALLSPKKDPQLMSTISFSASTKAYAELEAEVQAFKARIRQIIRSDEDQASGAYHINLHLFSNLESESP